MAKMYVGGGGEDEEDEWRKMGTVKCVESVEVVKVREIEAG